MVAALLIVLAVAEAAAIVWGAYKMRVLYRFINRVDKARVESDIYFKADIAQGWEHTVEQNTLREELAGRVLELERQVELLTYKEDDR